MKITNRRIINALFLLAVLIGLMGASGLIGTGDAYAFDRSAFSSRSAPASKPYYLNTRLSRGGSRDVIKRNYGTRNRGRFADNYGNEIMEDSGDENKIDEKKRKRAYHKKRLLIKFSEKAEEKIERGEGPNIRHGLKRGLHRGMRGLRRGQAWMIEVGEDESADEVLQQYMTDYPDEIEYIQFDYECTAQGDAEYIAADESPLQNSQIMWYLNQINIQKAWDETNGDPSVVIAVLDTGIGYEEHPLAEEDFPKVAPSTTSYKKAFGLSTVNLWTNRYEIPDNNIDDDGNGYVDDVHGFDFVNDDGHPNDDCGHGTFLANLIGYDFEANRVGIASQCSIMSVKVLDYSGKGYSSTLAEGIHYAVDHGANIINLSLAWALGIDPGPIVEEAILYAVNAGVIVLAGTGNNAKNRVCYPAAYDEVIAVGATQFDRLRAYYSNYGGYAEIMAPGGDINSDQNEDGYSDGILQETLWPRYSYSQDGEILANPSVFGFTLTQGTSMATAIASGVVGLMLSVNSELSLQDVRNILYSTVTDIENVGWDKESGYGLIDAGSAIERVCKGGPFDFEYDKPLPDTAADPAVENHTDDPEPPPEEVDPGIESTLYGPCSNPECLNDLEIEIECDSCLYDEEIEEECD